MAIFIEFSMPGGGVESVPVPVDVHEGGPAAVDHWVVAECARRGLTTPLGESVQKRTRKGGGA